MKYLLLKNSKQLYWHNKNLVRNKNKKILSLQYSTSTNIKIQTTTQLFMIGLHS